MLINMRNAMMAGGEIPPAYWGLCFTAEEPAVVNMTKTGSPPAVTLETSFDGKNWTPFDADGGTTPISLAAKKRVYFRAGTGGNTRMSSDPISAYRRFTLTGRCAASGDISSLLNAEHSIVEFSSSNENCFAHLFYSCTSLTSAPELPATKLVNSCYWNMFYGCTSLTIAPALPATNLVYCCYNGMFENCTSLIVAPLLNAQSLGSYCMRYMFKGCASLATVQSSLPATTLAPQCYAEMFRNCTSLTTAPNLPSTAIANYCYGYMFAGCTSLISAPTLPATTLKSSCYESMFYGCTSLTVAPALPATTLVSSCYNNMFRGCTSLTTAPSLPATTVASYAYYIMFFGCSKLNSIEVALTSWPTNNDWIINWLYGVASSGTFRCPTALGTNETIERGASRCPTGWTVINTDAA